MSETSGLAALVGALAQNELGLITGVYGDPCTVLLDELARTGLHVEISVEEKTALAQALGASVAGVRAAVVIKQVGANVASDPLVGATTHGCGAGLLVIVGDDPGAQKSTVELDSRWYALLSELPVLTPQDPAHLARSVREGIELSEQLGLPVLMQITARLLGSTGSEALPDSRARTHGQFERGRAWDRLILERYQYFYQKIQPELQAQVERSELHRISRGPAKEGVISCGFVSSLVGHENHFALGYANPLPQARLSEFMRPLQRVLVVEEVAPIIERAAQALVGLAQLKTEIIGRLSGHLPRFGGLERQQIEAAWQRQPQGADLKVQAQPNSSIMELPCGGFEPLYRALAELLPQGYPVAGDVGCSILHGYFPPKIITTAYGLGTSIATASGFSLAGKKGIAIIGDTGFVHSGITALLNAAQQRHNLLVIVLCNGISAMTPGAQAIPGLERIAELARACGATEVEQLRLAQTGPSELSAKLKHHLDQPGVQVLLIRAQATRLSG